MKLSTFFVSSVVLFSVAFARLHERAVTRAVTRTAARKSRPNAVISPSNSSNVAFSSNWAGVVLTSPPAGQTFSTVTGTFNVPTATSNGGASVWVGIDGDTASQSILQAGVEIIFSNGLTEYFAWFEWFPQGAFEITNLAVSPGNVITVTVQSTSSTTGVVTVINDSTELGVFVDVSAPDSAAALLGQNAEWIVEDFEEDGELVQFADFTTVTISGASASTAESETLSPIGGTVLDIEQDGEILTSVTNNGADIVVTRV